MMTKIINKTDPNILLISIDDMNNWVRCLRKYPSAVTPNIDRLASRGTVFSHAHCPAPICVPGRTAVLSGIAPYSSGCYVNVNGIADHKGGMHSVGLEKTLPMSVFFAEHGYHTLGCGKIYHGGWHSRDQGDTPLWHENGCDGWNEAVMADLKRKPLINGRFHNSNQSGKDHFFWGPVNDADSTDLADEIVVDWVSRQLSRGFDRPFFLGAGLIRTHTPLIPPKRFYDLYDANQIVLPEPGEEAFNALPEFSKAIALTSGGHEAEGGNYYQLLSQDELRQMAHCYLACISYVDDCIGRILDALDASPYKDNTIVVLWADHGWSLGSHFHLQKWGLWQAVTNVPLIIAYPDGSASLCDVPVSTLDLYPTLADLCGLPSRSEWQGCSLFQHLEDPDAERLTPAITTYGPGNHSVRSRKGTYICYADGSEELYSFDDVNEERNLIDDPEWCGVKTELLTYLPEQEVMPLHWNEQDPREAVKDLKDGAVVAFGTLQDGIADTPISISACVQVEGPDAIIVSHHGISAGYALYVKEGRVCFALRDVPRPLQWGRFKPIRHIIRSDTPLPGKMTDVELHLDNAGTVVIKADGVCIGKGKVPGPLTHPIVSTVSAGHWYTPAPDADFIIPGDFTPMDSFPGRLESVSINFEMKGN